MSEPVQHPDLSSLLAAARASAPREISPLEARRRVRMALRTELGGRASIRRTLLISAVLAAAAAACFVLFRPQATRIEVAENAPPLRLSLRSGDVLLAAADTRFLVREDAPNSRAIELEAGAVLFEVQRLGRDRAFEVATRHARVRVLGTIFSVETDRSRTVVRVHEGRVAVADRVLTAGESWTSDGSIRAPDPFSGEAKAMVQGRSRAVAATLGAVRLNVPSVQSVQQHAAEGAIAVTPPTSPESSAERSAARSASLPEQSAPERARDVSFDERARSLLVAGLAEQALALAEQQRDREGALLIVADASRALGRFDEACDAYEQLAARAPRPGQVVAAFAAAQLALGPLEDPARALRILDGFALAHEDVPLRERASVLRVQALRRLGREDEAREQVRTYLEREPETATSERLRALLPE